MRRRSEGMACFDWSCFKARCAHVDIGQLKSSGLISSYAFAIQNTRCPIPKHWRRVTEPWKTDSCANAVTRVKSKEHSIEGWAEGLDVARVRDVRAAPTGAVSLAGAYKQRPVIAMLCRQVDTGRGSFLPTLFDLEHVVSSYGSAILMSGSPIPDHGFTIQRQTAFRRGARS